MRTGLFYYSRKEYCPQSFVPQSEIPFLSRKHIKQIEIPTRRGLDGVFVGGCMPQTLPEKGLTCPLFPKRLFHFVASPIEMISHVAVYMFCA